MQDQSKDKLDDSQIEDLKSKTNKNEQDEQQEQSQVDEEGLVEEEVDNKKKDEDRKYRKGGNQNKDKLEEVDQSGIQGIFLYKPGVELPNLFPFLQQQIKIIVAAEYVNKRNPEFIRKNVCGNETYTSNSDAVCMAIHSGMININTFNSRKFQVVRPKKTYTGVNKNGILSKGIKNYDGNALKPETIQNIATLPPIQLLQKYAANMNIPIGTKRTKSRPRCLSSIIPIPETHIVFNMNNQPAYKYSIFNIADKGFDKTQLVIKKLDHHALYLQTDDSKYQVVKYIKEVYFDFVKISKVKNPQRADNQFFSKTSIPLSPDLVQVLEEGAQWDQVVIGNSSIKVKNVEIEGIRSFKYYKMDVKK